MPVVGTNYQQAIRFRVPYVRRTATGAAPVTFNTFFFGSSSDSVTTSPPRVTAAVPTPVMPLLYRYQGTATQGLGEPPTPGSSAWGSVGVATGGKYDPPALDNILTGTSTIGSRSVETLRFRDALAGGAPRWDLALGAQPDRLLPTRLTGPYSLRFYFRIPNDTIGSYPLVSFYNQGSLEYWLLTFYDATNKNRPFFGTGLTGQAPALTPASGWFRCEIQVDPDRSPKVVTRYYAADSATVQQSLTANPTNTTIDMVRIGAHTAANLSGSELQFTDFEIYSDYTLGGQFTSNPASPTAASTTATGAPASNQTIDAKFNYNSATNSSLPGATLVDGTDYTTLINQHYTTAQTFGRQFTLYQPTGTPPAGGWPVVVWAHSGFFRSGSRADLPPAWRDDLLAAGYAVATISYVRTSVDANPTYDPYGTADPLATPANSPGFGRYPSMILDYKRAAAFIRDNASTASGGNNTYPNLNGQRLIATGFSAGGYLALAAATTRNLGFDRQGNELSLAKAAAAGRPWADGYTGSDPEFLGAFVYAAPIDLDRAAAWDPTRPENGSFINTAYRAFQGLLNIGTTIAPPAPHTTIAAFIAANAANVPPIAYVRGASDYLVHWEHQQVLADAMKAAGLESNYLEVVTPNIHNRANLIYDRETDIGIINGIAGNTGSDASVTTTAPTVTATVPEVSTLVVQNRSVETTSPAAFFNVPEDNDPFVQQNRTVNPDALTVGFSTSATGSVSGAVEVTPTPPVVTVTVPNSGAQIQQDRSVTPTPPAVNLSTSATGSVSGDVSVDVSAVSITFTAAATALVQQDRPITPIPPSVGMVVVQPAVEVTQIPILVGTGRITGLWIGNQTVSRVYVGSNLIWSNN